MALQSVKTRIPRVIAISPQMHTVSPMEQAKLRKVVRTAMSAPGGSITSRTGMTAALAINWCEERGEPYVVTAIPGQGYCVQRSPPQKEKHA